ncbi:hypothetical protein L596_010370 [Steinernema carpocapsae]|uniref:Uncharacterized protein n=1 Tax=Steinernema carpocapsae TaxID=34508 RepID=A0A4U5PIP3_STECR|nr:hypothetical protein L596_010370 [Steinernema carpocapsae]
MKKLPAWIRAASAKLGRSDRSCCSEKENATILGKIEKKIEKNREKKHHPEHERKYQPINNKTEQHD